MTEKEVRPNPITEDFRVCPLYPVCTGLRGSVSTLYRSSPSKFCTPVLTRLSISNLS